MPFLQKEKVAEFVEDMLEKGSFDLLLVHGQAPLFWSQSGMVRSLQFCIDYQINSITKKDVYPLPHINDNLE